jgi:hypothetical protein
MRHDTMLCHNLLHCCEINFKITIIFAFTEVSEHRETVASKLALPLMVLGGSTR